MIGLIFLILIIGFGGLCLIAFCEGYSAAKQRDLQIERDLRKYS